MTMRAQEVSQCRRYEDSAPNRFFGTSRSARGPNYQHALAKQVARPDLPYTIEMWSDLKKVLFVQWDQNDELQVFSFRPGEWEVRLAERAAQDEGGK
jgi:hypothetical protein